MAIYTAKVASKYISQQQKFFEYELRDKVQFIIYNKQSHFKQSNVGLSIENGELGGITNILGSKIFLYFDGSHENFNQQIKQGIAQIMVNQQVYGSNWRQVLKNSSLLSLPDWYHKGLTSYLANNWSSDIENSVRDGISSGKYKKFNRLSNEESAIAGHSLWAYIIDTYGESVIPNILYMTRVTQSVEKGFIYVLGISMKDLTIEWVMYYKNRFKGVVEKQEDEYKRHENLKIRKRRQYSQFKISADGNNYAYVTHQLGQYKIYIYYLDSDKKYKIFKKEFKLDRINDNSYPILAWHPSGEVLAFVTEEKGLLLMHYFDINTGGIQVKTVFNLEKVLAMDYSDSGKEMVFSGAYKGQSDLYLYHIGSNSQKKITNDVFDDLDPRFIDNSSRIVFTSNRLNDSIDYQPTDNELLLNKRDVWVIDHLSEDKTLRQVTKTPQMSEEQPFGVDSVIYYLGNEDEITIRHSAVRDSFITHIDTSIHYHHFYEANASKSDYTRGIKEQYINESGQYSEILIDDYKYHLMVKDIHNPEIDSQKEEINLKDSTTYKEEPYFSIDNVSTSPVILKSVPISVDTFNYAIDINSYVFEKEQKTQRNTVVVGNQNTNDDVSLEEFKLPNQRNYNLSFFNDNSSIKLSNSFVNKEYQIFTGGPFISPGIGGALKLGTIDLFEDYKVFGGIRFSSGTREYFLTFQDYLKRWDKEYTFSRTTSSFGDGVNVFGVSTNTLHYSLKYPFSEVTSIRTTLSAKNDNIVVRSTDINALQAPNFNEYRAVGKVAFVFDNTRKKMTNIYYGTRFKIFGEYYQEVLDNNAGNGNNGNTQVVGLDFRHSQKISREFVWVNRLAASSSFGSEKLIYYLGSVDDWIPLAGQERFINQDDIDFTINYRYQALAANLRGFAQNIRRGTNFAVINSELRLPVFKYFIRRPIRSKFVTNFQLIAFADVGTAWNGLDPWSRDNSINRDVITDGPLTVTLFKNIEPIVAGYGFGLRTTLLGYFIRADWAWGVENRISKNAPMFYLSLSLDI